MTLSQHPNPLIQRLRHPYGVAREQLETPGDYPNEAGILLAVTDHPENPEIVLTRRADHLTSHGGEVSFPGGKWEPEDHSLLHTALRESEEEVKLPPARVEVLNVQPPMLSRWGIKVTPYVGIIPHDCPLEANPDELAAVFRVPVQYFLDDRRTHTDVYFREDHKWWAPVYHYEGYKIWGLTSRILVDFVNTAWDAGITRESQAPEVERKPLLANNR